MEQVVFGGRMNIPKGTTFFKTGENVEHVYLLVNGQVRAKSEYMKMNLDNGALLGILDIYSEEYLFDYEAVTDLIVLCFDIAHADGIQKLLKLGKNYQEIAVNSLFAQFHEVYRLYEKSFLSYASEMDDFNVINKEEDSAKVDMEICTYMNQIYALDKKVFHELFTAGEMIAYEHLITGSKLVADINSTALKLVDVLGKAALGIQDDEAQNKAADDLSDGEDTAEEGMDEKDEDTKRQNGNNKPFSQLHINGLYDCINHVFWDTSIDTATKTRECTALMKMIMRHDYPVNSIITADRGYEKYNLMACCIENNQKFVFRIKDINVFGSILSNLNLPHEEFDLDVTKILTRKQTNEAKNNKDKFTIMKKESDFDYFDDDGFYELNLRVVRFKITKETYECLVTNLTRDEFDLNELKKMYHMRWNIETAFKMLKYIIGMMSFHSKKRNFIQQEIYAAILLHCLTNIITERIEVEQSDKRKHHYKVNLSTAVTNMRLWLRKIICTKEMIKRIKKYLAPVRPDRKYQRNMKPKSAIPFNTKAS